MSESVHSGSTQSSIPSPSPAEPAATTPEPATARLQTATFALG